MAKRSQSRINLLLGIDKPSGMTSHDVVARVRRALGERRVGHAGTLDPMATGVMVVGVGQATRLLGLITLDTKSYIAEISFGAETDTDDLEGRVVREAPARPELFDSEFAARAVSEVIGVQEQVPLRIPLSLLTESAPISVHVLARMSSFPRVRLRSSMHFCSVLRNVTETPFGPLPSR